MAITLVQSNTGSWSSPNGTITLTGVTSGNLLVVAFHTRGLGSGIVVTVGDGGTNTYHEAIAPVGSGAGKIYLWYAYNVTGGSLTITTNVNQSSTNWINIPHVYEYSGILVTDPLDKTSTNASSGSSLTSGSTATTSQADELIFGLGAIDSNTHTLSVGSGYGNFLSSSISDGGSLKVTATEDKIVSSTGTYAATMGISAAEAYTAGVATFKADAGVSVNISDSVTVSESIGYYSDTVFIRESYNVQIQAAGTLSVNVSDTITVTESTNRMLESYVSTSDTITLSESLQRILESYVDKSDSITVSENLKELLESYVNKSDTITITENVADFVYELFINVNDSITVNESPSVNLPAPGAFSIATSDNIAVSENVNAFITPLFVNVNDTITITESIGQLLESNINTNDTVTITESIGRLLQSYINVSDTITVSESISVSLASTDTPTINVSDNITVSESVQVFVTPLYVNVNDSITITESVQAFLTPLNINVNDNITVSESINIVESAIGALSISVSDSITVSESVNRVLESNINKSDSITVTESNSVNLSISLSVADSVSITDTPSLAVSAPQVVVSDSVTVSESRNITLVDNVNKSDTITITENVAVNVSTVPTLAIIVSDTFTVTEYVKVRSGQKGRVEDGLVLDQKNAGIILHDNNNVILKQSTGAELNNRIK